MTEPDTGSAPEQEPTPAEETQPAQAPAEPEGAEESNPEESNPEQSAPEQSSPDVSSVEQQLAERTLDLQRLQAEYVNYKRRVDRDRELVRAQGEAKVLESLLTVLDDIGRADQHGELEGGFKAVADSLQAAVAKHGLEPFGAEGDEFDPKLHEAVFQVGESSDVTVTTVGQVLRIGYRVGDRMIREATVGVIEPAAPSARADESTDGPTEGSGDQPETASTDD